MRELTGNAKGTIAELAIQLAAAKLGIGTYKPIEEHARADLVLETGGVLWRVQCKWGRLAAGGDCVVVQTGGSRLPPRGYVRAAYGEAAVDLLASYCGELDRCYLLPPAVFAGRSLVTLRLKAPRNNQRACINLADSFAFEGAIAQLGERCHGMAEVVGSSPTSSTPPSSTDRPASVVGANAFRDGFGDWMARVAAGEEVIVTRHGRPQVRLSPAPPGPARPLTRA